VGVSARLGKPLAKKFEGVIGKIRFKKTYIAIASSHLTEFSAELLIVGHGCI
jgi:hypothetical protein